MRTLTIAIGSERPPKVRAVQAAVDRIRDLLLPEGGSIGYISRSVESGVPGMPRSQEEMMRGAASRVRDLIQRLRREGVAADFYIGLEGGFYRAAVADQQRTFLQGWVYVSDGGRGHFGSTGSMEVPPQIAHLVYEEHRELGDIIDDFAAASDIRNKEGAFGVFSLGVLTRQQCFEFAIIAAFAPFYHTGLYRR